MSERAHPEFRGRVVPDSATAADPVDPRLLEKVATAMEIQTLQATIAELRNVILVLVGARFQSTGLDRWPEEEGAEREQVGKRGLRQEGGGQRKRPRADPASSSDTGSVSRTPSPRPMVEATKRPIELPL